MASLPWVKFYPSDYLADTVDLSLAEHGAYCLLLWHYHQTGQPIPDDDKKICRILRCDSNEWANVRSNVRCFFVQREGQLINERMETELEGVKSRSEQARQAGKASAKKRAKSNRNPTDVPTDVPTVVENQLQPKSNHTEQNRTDTEQREREPDALAHVWQGADPEIVAEYLKRRKTLGKPVDSFGLDQTKRVLALCQTPAQRSEALQNSGSERHGQVYARHLPEELRRKQVSEKPKEKPLPRLRDVMAEQGIT